MHIRREVGEQLRQMGTLSYPTPKGQGVPMEYSQALAERIDTRIAELKGEIESHERALQALKGVNARNSSTNAPPARAAQTKADGRVPRRPRRRRVASADAVFDALSDGNDQAAVIATQFGVPTAMVRNRLQELEEAGRVTRSGQRRATRWRSNAG
jgi:predicted Rossmann fold nucleotide-binding protein DprA/Smf involved in DNA uptake